MHLKANDTNFAEHIDYQNKAVYHGVVSLFWTLEFECPLGIFGLLFAL